jgi:hypothetical protein
MASIATNLIAASSLICWAASTFAAETACSSSSGESITPVIELYTSEGCSSCPPADKWASSLKHGGAVVQAFHVGYWDHIGWVDRFAAPAHTARQRDVATANRLRSIYTPQVVVNGRDTPGWYGARPEQTAQKPARLNITVNQQGADQFEAQVTASGSQAADTAALPWSAYWSVTEHGHSSRVQSGENAGEFLKHDFVVRQYTPAGEYSTSGSRPQRLTFRSIATTPGHPRQINLVVFDRKTGDTLQAVSLQCAVAR